MLKIKVQETSDKPTVLDVKTSDSLNTILVKFKYPSDLIRFKRLFDDSDLSIASHDGELDSWTIGDYWTARAIDSYVLEKVLDFVFSECNQA